MTSNLVSGPDGLMDAAMAAWVEAPSNAISYMAGIRAVAMLVRNRSDDVPTKSAEHSVKMPYAGSGPFFRNKKRYNLIALTQLFTLSQLHREFR